MNTQLIKQRANAGYTIDQTILIVAVIAILITLIIASVGWDILNRTSGTKLAGAFRQIEDANGQFFARTGMWPHVATENPAMEEVNIAVLANDSNANTAVASAGNVDVAERMKNLISGLENNGGVIEHAFGGGGLIQQGESAAGECPGTETFLRIEMQNMPLTEIEEADEAMDNSDGPTEGRLRWNGSATSATPVFYCGNLLR